jgi:hypothetical protein
MPLRCSATGPVGMLARTPARVLAQARVDPAQVQGAAIWLMDLLHNPG